MDAVKFIKERNRMCKTNVSCFGCPAHDIGSSNSCKFAMENWLSPEQQIEIVEKWSKEHPPKTRQSEFIKQFPLSKVDTRGILCIQPCELGYDMEIDCINTDCYFCRQEYWNTPVK